MTRHSYEVEMTWTGNTGTGPALIVPTRGTTRWRPPVPRFCSGHPIPHSAGDVTRWNPVQLYLTSVSQCHLLWYLDLAARAGVIVTAYEDRPIG